MPMTECCTRSSLEVSFQLKPLLNSVIFDFTFHPPESNATLLLLLVLCQTIRNILHYYAFPPIQYNTKMCMSVQTNSGHEVKIIIWQQAGDWKTILSRVGTADFKIIITWADNPRVKYWKVFLACCQSWSRERTCLRMDTSACTSIRRPWCSFSCAGKTEVRTLIRLVMTLPTHSFYSSENTSKALI